MSGDSKKSQHVSIRLPLRELAAVDAYAAANSVSRSQAVAHYLRAGIAAEAGERPVTSAEIEALRGDLKASFQAMAKAIESQPIAVQALPAPKREKGKKGKKKRKKKR